MLFRSNHSLDRGLGTMFAELCGNRLFEHSHLVMESPGCELAGASKQRITGEIHFVKMFGPTRKPLAWYDDTFERMPERDNT